MWLTAWKLMKFFKFWFSLRFLQLKWPPLNEPINAYYKLIMCLPKKKNMMHACQVPVSTQIHRIPWARHLRRSISLRRGEKIENSQTGILWNVFFIFWQMRGIRNESFLISESYARNNIQSVDKRPQIKRLSSCASKL